MKRLLFILTILLFSCENLEEKREVRKRRPNIIYRGLHLLEIQIKYLNEK